MARTGRPAKPPELKRRAGNPGRRPLPEPLVVLPAPASPPDPPRRLGRVGRSLWRVVWLAGCDWLAAADAPLVTLLCEAAEERERWMALVAEQGRTFTTEKGYVGLHPGVAQVRVLSREMMSMLGLLGFTPSDRARLGLAEVRRMTQLGELMQRRQQELGR